MMFAVIRTGGKQYRVQKGDILQVERLGTKQGKTVVFDEVLLIQDGKKTLIGTPLVAKAQVKAEVIENFRDDKVIIFKKKRRKQYKKKAGHRQMLTRVKIEEIVSSAKAPARKPKPEVNEKKAPEKPAKKAAVPKEEKQKKLEAKKKPEAVKKPAAKKPEIILEKKPAAEKKPAVEKKPAAEKKPSAKKPEVMLEKKPAAEKKPAVEKMPEPESKAEAKESEKAEPKTENDNEKKEA